MPFYRRHTYWECRSDTDLQAATVLAAMNSTTSLVLALGGFSVDAESDQSAMQEGAEAPLEGSCAWRRQVAAGTQALVAHASSTVSRVVEGWETLDADVLQHSCETLAALCFALQSALGPNTSLADGEERQLFEAASGLWVRPGPEADVCSTAPPSNLTWFCAGC